jgi:glutaredoxin-like protein NrdH
MNLTKVPGKNNKHKIRVYALSTCVHCKATLQFLRESDVEFEYIHVDQCDKKDLAEIMKDIQKRGGSFSFPKIIVDDKTMISGFVKDKIKETIEV